MLLYELAQAFDSQPSLVNEDICTIDEDNTTSLPYVTCICPNRENFTYSSMLVENLNIIKIKGCGKVHIGFDALSNLHLKELQLTEIQSLVLEPFTLLWVQKIEFLKLHHISNLIIQPHAFVGLHNVDTFIMSNVTVEKLSKDTFSSVTNIRFMSIEDCVFDRVEQNAFATYNITVLKVSNSIFRVLQSHSFFIMSSEEVRFEHCSFGCTENGTFIVSHVNSFYFQNCQFGNLVSNSIQSNDIKLFNLSDSVIDVLQSDAFADLKVIEKIVFKRNIIKIIYNDSLQPFLNPTLDYVNLDFCCNQFTCDCNIYWMYKLEDPAQVLENNSCIEDPFRSLALYQPILDSSNECMTLEYIEPENGNLRNSSYRPMINFITSRANHIDIIFIIFISWIFTITSVKF